MRTACVSCSSTSGCDRDDHPVGHARAFFYRARVYTAYEYLETRFDLKTRTMASVLFLLSRGMSCGAIIAAPAVILSIILDWNLTLTILAIGLPTILYTMIGGVQAVTWTDVKQMAVIVFGLLAAITALLIGMPDGIGFGDALHVAGAAGRLNAIDFRFDIRQTYVLVRTSRRPVSALCKLGCDQSQVQRYLTARSVDEGRHSLLMSAYFKIPLQALVLLTGILVFVFYLFIQPPMLFKQGHAAPVDAAGGEQSTKPRGRVWKAFETRKRNRRIANAGDDRQRTAAGATFRTANDGSERSAGGRRRSSAGDWRRNIVTGLATPAGRQLRLSNVYHDQAPIGLVGLMIAAIFAAAMSSIAALQLVGRIGHRRLPQDTVRRNRRTPQGVEAGDRVLGRLCLRRRVVRGKPGVSHRGREPFRVVFLWLAVGRLRSRRCVPSHDRYGRVRRPDRRHGRGADRRVPSRDEGDLVPLAESDRGIRRRCRRAGGEHAQPRPDSGNESLTRHEETKPCAVPPGERGDREGAEVRGENKLTWTAEAGRPRFALRRPVAGGDRPACSHQLVVSAASAPRRPRRFRQARGIAGCGRRAYHVRHHAQHRSRRNPVRCSRRLNAVAAAARAVRPRDRRRTDHRRHGIACSDGERRD
jgi:hypothetical protein